MSDKLYTCDKPDCFACYMLNRNKKRVYNQKQWTEWEENFLRDNYYKTPRSELSEFLNRSPSSLWQKMHEINKRAAA